MDPDDNSVHGRDHTDANWQVTADQLENRDELQLPVRRGTAADLSELLDPEKEVPLNRRGRKTSVRWALAGLSLSMLLSALGTSVANVALPTLAHAFAASFQEVQWVVLAYLLAITTLIVSVGRLGDLTGGRRLLLVGISLFTVASVVAGLAPTLGLLIASLTLIRAQLRSRRKTVATGRAFRVRSSPTRPD